MEDAVRLGVEHVRARAVARPAPRRRSRPAADRRPRRRRRVVPATSSPSAATFARGAGRVEANLTRIVLRRRARRQARRRQAQRRRRGARSGGSRFVCRHEPRVPAPPLSAGGAAGAAPRLAPWTRSRSRAGSRRRSACRSTELADCAASAIERDGRRVLSYGSTLGYGPLREWIAERARRSSPAVCSSPTARCRRSTSCSTRSAAAAACSSSARPTTGRARSSRGAASSSARCRWTSDGLDVDALERELDGPPAGASSTRSRPSRTRPARRSPSERRRRLVELVARNGSCRCSRTTRTASCASRASRCRRSSSSRAGTASCTGSSFSKTIAPGLRVGYAIVSGRSSRRSSRRSSPRPTSRPRCSRRRPCTSSCAAGCFEPNLERVCGLLASPARRDARARSSASSPGARRWNRPEGGYFLWLDLPEEVDAAELLARASEAGVTFVPGADFGGPASSARLAFSFVSPDEIDEGVRRLAALVAPAAAPV